MRIFLLFLLAFFCSSAGLLAQGHSKTAPRTQQQDVVYLKNGWVLHGTIMESDTTGRLRIRSEQNNIFTFDTNEVLRIEKEEIAIAAPTTQSKPHSSSPAKPAPVRVRRPIYHPDAEHIYIASEFTFSGMRISAGKNITPNIQVGGGIGLGMRVFSPGAEGTAVFRMPIFAEARFDASPTRKTTPFAAVQLGYTQPLYRNDQLNNTNYAKGREYVDVRFGLKFFTTEKFSVLLGIGYRRETSYQEVTVWQWNASAQQMGASPATNLYTIQRPSASLGFMF